MNNRNTKNKLVANQLKNRHVVRTLKWVKKTFGNGNNGGLGRQLDSSIDYSIEYLESQDSAIDSSIRYLDSLDSPDGVLTKQKEV